MNIDGLSMHFLAKELQSNIIGSRISKITQLNNSLVVFNLRLNKERLTDTAELRLLIDVDKNNPAVLLTEQNFQAPAVAPNFCMFLRKYLQNGLITNVNCPNFERYLVFTINAKNSYFDIVEYRLIVELMGKYSNLILTENNVIKDCLQHVDSSLNSQRELLPMHPYIAPPEQVGKLSLLSFEQKSALLEHLLANAQTVARKLKDLIVNKLLGISPLLSRSLCLSAHLDPNCPIDNFITSVDSQSALSDVLYKLREYILDSKVEPHLYRKEANWQNLLAFSLYACPSDHQKAFPSFSEALLEARSQTAFNSAFSQKQNQLLLNLNQQIAKLSHKLDTYQADIQASLDFAIDKIKGDLILANMSNCKRLLNNSYNDEFDLTLTNFYQEVLPDDLLDEINEYINNPEQQFKIIELLSAPEIIVHIKNDKVLSLIAKNYFKSYSKKKNRLLIVRALAKDCKQNLQFYAESKINLLNATTLSDLDAVKTDLFNFSAANMAELQANRTEDDNKLNNQPGKPASRRRILLARQREQANNQRRLNKSKQTLTFQQKSSNKLDYINYLSSDGYQILIGKNATQNDYLSLHYAKENDIWLHLQKAPGCHVLIINPNKEVDTVPQNTILEAAQLCAWYSRSQEERHTLSSQSLASVNVDYCLASKLKKAAKAKAGLVYYNNYKTLKVQGKSPEKLGLQSCNLQSTVD